ncbi:MAG: hypothetical protein ACOYNS_09845 [Bacteroidota bacterium]
MRIFLVILFTVFFCTDFCSAQRKGDFFIGYGFEFPSGGYLSLRYFPVEKIGVEVYTSAFWYIFNYGARMNVHIQNGLPNSFITIGYSHMTAFNPGAVHDTTGAEKLFLQRSMQGIDLGFGREVEYDFKHFSFQLGPTYVLTLEDGYIDAQRKIVTYEVPTMFSYYFVATQLAQLPEKNPKPIYIRPQ